MVLVVLLYCLMMRLFVYYTKSVVKLLGTQMNAMALEGGLSDEALNWFQNKVFVIKVFQKVSMAYLCSLCFCFSASGLLFATHHWIEEIAYQTLHFALGIIIVALFRLRDFDEYQKLTDNFELELQNLSRSRQSSYICIEFPNGNPQKPDSKIHSSIKTPNLTENRTSKVVTSHKPIYKVQEKSKPEMGEKPKLPLGERGKIKNLRRVPPLLVLGVKEKLNTHNHSFEFFFED